MFSQTDAAAVNLSDPYGKRLFQELTAENSCSLIGYSSDTEDQIEKPALCAENISLFADRCECDLVYHDQREHAVLGLPGSFR